MTEAEKEDAYAKGLAAFADDRGIDDCPYVGDAREAWEQGFADARDDDYQARNERIVH
jgi:ribosome modulation factor